MNRVRSIVFGVLLSMAGTPLPGQTVRRTADGKPNFNGIWQALNTAAWDIQDHGGQLGLPPGQGIVEGNTIPYQPSAAAKKSVNFANRATADPTEANCFLPGVPRATYMPFPFQIAQTPKEIAILYEFAHALRSIPMDGSPHPDGLPDTWMGDSRGLWEGNTLIVDTTNFNGRIAYSREIPYLSDQLHTVERFTIADGNTIDYEVTIDDPVLFTKPWKVAGYFTRVPKGVESLEFACAEGSQTLVNIFGKPPERR